MRRRWSKQNRWGERALRREQSDRDTLGEPLGREEGREQGRKEGRKEGEEREGGREHAHVLSQTATPRSKQGTTLPSPTLPPNGKQFPRQHLRLLLLPPTPSASHSKTRQAG